MVYQLHFVFNGVEVLTNDHGPLLVVDPSSIDYTELPLEIELIVVLLICCIKYRVVTVPFGIERQEINARQQA